ncbi:acetate--CoA ligase family protein [Bradyrhizobium sp. 169]|uniref:acetate--CoA ligase family protein n=1 Tax=Bradyrhizobium sp. 169 TaxID=2782640 RepID=UPI001FF95239|nr:acetate--CoA ligase family protein [Bradyrhizobium sp. 169]MCK1589094.1 acetate--CoA ligase family protein [Bradyrhizobium sp. 169]
MTMNSNLQVADAIDRLFRPESVAIVGASPKGSYVTNILNNLKTSGFSGKLAAVNPRYEQVDGIACFPSLTAIPHPVGVVVVGIPSDAVPPVLDDCEAAGVGAIQIISSGFADQGAEGIVRQRRLVEWAKRTRIPVAEPNCYGLLNADNGLIALPDQLPALKAGGISAVVQSGALAMSMLMPLIARGIGIGRVVTTGNEACVDVADFIHYLVGDEETRVIACYCEQFKRPREFIKACEHAAENGKPIVMIKVGRSEGARQAALAHTGSLVGSDVAIDAVLKKLGVIRVDAIDDLIETAAALSSNRRPRGRRVAYMSFCGGANSMVSDLAETCGVELPPLPNAVKTQLDAVIPEFGSVGNSLDLTTQSYYQTHILDESLVALATSGAYDVVVWGSSWPAPIDMRSAVGQALTRAADSAQEVVFPMLTTAGGHVHATPLYAGSDRQSAVLKSEFEGMPLLHGMGAGLKALSRLIGYAEFLRTRKPSNRLSGQWGQRSARYAEAVTKLRAVEGGTLTEREGKSLLALYGIPVTREALATRPEEATRIAEDLGFPVAMKVEAAEIVHKTDVGGVVLKIASADEAAAAFGRIVTCVRTHRPEAGIAGVLVQEMAKTGIEVMLGATFDPQFGLVIAVGLGGIWVEALKDICVLLPTFDAADVQEAIGQLRAASVLRGARGGAKPDLRGLAEAVVNFGTLCGDLADEIGEIDINPITLAADGSGLTAVDCLITKRTSNEV